MPRDHTHLARSIDASKQDCAASTGRRTVLLFLSAVLVVIAVGCGGNLEYDRTADPDEYVRQVRRELQSIQMELTAIRNSLSSYPVLTEHEEGVLLKTLDNLMKKKPFWDKAKYPSSMSGVHEGFRAALLAYYRAAELMKEAYSNMDIEHINEAVSIMDSATQSLKSVASAVE